MLNHFVRLTGSFLLLTILLFSFSPISSAAAPLRGRNTPRTSFVSTHKRTHIATKAMRAMDMHKVPSVSVHKAKQPARGSSSNSHSAILSLAPQTPTATTFQSIADTDVNCPQHCTPPDQAIAASPGYVFQGVNNGFSVYSTTGATQSGWPITPQNFFGVPDPGSCDSKGPFLADPRVAYDSNDQRFWASMLQVEGIAEAGPQCSLQSNYWIAFTASADPTGLWCSYGFSLQFNPQYIADFDTLGFDSQAIYFSANIYQPVGTQGKFQYSEIFAFPKPTASFSSCPAGFTAWGFINITDSNGTVVDTLQPAMAEQAGSGWLQDVGLFVSSYNITSGGHNCTLPCQNVVVWALTHPGTQNTTLASTIISTPLYRPAPAADQPGCSGCISTGDTRISSTPVYHNGLLTFALDTQTLNGLSSIPGILWGQASVNVDDTGTFSVAYLYQSGYFFFTNGQAAYYPAFMADNVGNLLMVFETSSSTLNPSTWYVSRNFTDPLGQLSPNDSKVLKKGDATDTQCQNGSCPFGDYEAASYDGFSTNHLWFAGEYTASNGKWSTYVGHISF